MIPGMLEPELSAEPAARPDRIVRRGVPSPERLAFVEEIVREISTHTDPQTMVSFFRNRAPHLFGGEGSISMSRRGMAYPRFRITRSSSWKTNVDPWACPDLLPTLEGGRLAELIYAGEPVAMDSVTIDPRDPAREFIGHARSMLALPLYDNGESLNMVIRLSAAPNHFDDVDLAEALLTANLFGRATSSMVTARELKKAYGELDFEMRRVADIQRSLLPTEVPRDVRFDIAVSYRAAARAGGDYYDFFQLGDGRWGMLIADVSGHGTPAAVVMAVLRTILHGECHTCSTPAAVLESANRRLMNQSDRNDGTFVTACDPCRGRHGG